MKLRSGKAYNYDTPAVSRKRKANNSSSSSREQKDRQLPSKQQKIDHVQERPVVSASSSDTPPNIPHVLSSPISITEVLASTYDTASHAPHLARLCRGKSVDLNSRHDAPSTSLVYSRSRPSWVSLPLTPHSCTRSWYVLSGCRANPRHYSLLGSRSTSSFVPKLPEIPEEEESDNESLDIGLERQVHFENNVTVYSYDSIRDRSRDVKIKSYHRELQ